MKRYLLITLSVLCFIAVDAQNRGNVKKRMVEKSKVTNTKTHYNYFLLDAVNSADDAYTEYENIVQQVWSEKLPPASIKKEKVKAIDTINEYIELVQTTPVFQGGDEYRTAVLNYIKAVKEKVNDLETLGLLGADKDADATLYNNASIKFTDISNEAIDLRNIVRNKKGEYERKVYVNKK